MLMDEFPDYFRGVKGNADPLEDALDDMGEEEEHEDPEVTLTDEP